jgi:hypothetical protein
MWRVKDAEHAEAYFRDETLIEHLKEQKYDIGIASPYVASSLLFKELGIPYLKIHGQDVESSAMQYKFGMATAMSNSPNALAYQNYAYGDLPSLDSSAYRLHFNRIYYWVKLLQKPFHHLSPLRESLPNKYKHLLDSYHQENALILTEGTNVGIF